MARRRFIVSLSDEVSDEREKEIMIQILSLEGVADIDDVRQRRRLKLDGLGNVVSEILRYAGKAVVQGIVSGSIKVGKK